MSQRLRTIKSIRILDSQYLPKPNNNSAVSTARSHALPTTARAQKENTGGRNNSGRSPTPKITLSRHNSNRTSLSKSPCLCEKDLVDSEESERQNLMVMLGRLEKKEKKQMKTMESLQGQHDEYLEEKMRNQELKNELLEMKDLMKELLMEREELRMFRFYQDE